MNKELKEESRKFFESISPKSGFGVREMLMQHNVYDIVLEIMCRFYLSKSKEKELNEILLKGTITALEGKILLLEGGILDLKIDAEGNIVKKNYDGCRTTFDYQDVEEEYNSFPTLRQEREELNRLRKENDMLNEALEQPEEEISRQLQAKDKELKEVYDLLDQQCENLKAFDLEGQILTVVEAALSKHKEEEVNDVLVDQLTKKKEKWLNQGAQ